MNQAAQAHCGQRFDFANILFAGPCNQSCPYCIGKQLPAALQRSNLDEYPLRNLDAFAILRLPISSFKGLAVCLRPLSNGLVFVLAHHFESLRQFGNARELPTNLTNHRHGSASDCFHGECREQER